MGKIDPRQLKYRNITVSGLPGAGSTTLMRLLEQKLGWKGYSGGEFMRAYALEKGLFRPNGGLHHAATDYEDDFDRKIDYGIRDKLRQESGGIYEAWLSGFLAQGIKGALKVLVYCSEDAVRVDRVVNRDGISVVRAKKHIFEREVKNREKWTRMYKKEWEEWVVEAGVMKPNEKIDFWNPSLYDLTIDTYPNSREETLKLVLGKLAYYARKGKR